MARDGNGRNGIETPAAKWMATQQTPESQSGAAKRTVSRNRDGSVFRTGRHKSASAATQRMHRGRQPAAVELEHSEKDACHRTGSALPDRVTELGFARACSAFACWRIRTI